MIKRQEIERVIQKYRFELLKQIITKDSEFWQTIAGVKIAVTYNSEKKTKNFQCVYLHHTENFNDNDYLPDDEDHNDDLYDETKDTKLEFGYIDDTFYIVNSKNIQVYSKRESPELPVAFNFLYETRLDEYEQSNLLERYSENKNIPEWFAIAFFTSIRLGAIKINTLVDKLYFD